jgi:hypothetical protein
LSHVWQSCQGGFARRMSVEKIQSFVIRDKQIVVVGIDEVARHSTLRVGMAGARSISQARHAEQFDRAEAIIGWKKDDATHIDYASNRQS